MAFTVNKYARYSMLTQLSRHAHYIDLYGGVMPTDPEAAIATPLLARFPYMFMAGTEGTDTIWLPEPVMTTCLTSGTVTWARWWGNESGYVTPDKHLAVMGAAGVAGTPGAVFIVSEVNLTTDSDVWLNSLRASLPAN